MNGAARLAFAFDRPRQGSSLLAALFAAAIMPVDLASAESSAYQAIHARVVTKSEPSELLPKIDASNVRSKILALDSSSGGSPSQTSCDPGKKHTCEELVQDNILWTIDDPDNSASKHWQQRNLDNLCECTTDPYATVNCFQIQVNNNRKTWQEAIAMCRAKP